MAIAVFNTVNIFSKSAGRPDGPSSSGFSNYNYTGDSDPIGLVTANPRIAGISSIDSIHWQGADGGPLGVGDLLGCEIPSADIVAAIPSNAIISSIFAEWEIEYACSFPFSMTPNFPTDADTFQIFFQSQARISILNDTAILQDTVSGFNVDAHTFNFSNEYIPSGTRTRAFLLNVSQRRFTYQGGGGGIPTASIHTPGGSLTVAAADDPGEWILSVLYTVTYTLPIVPPTQLTVTPDTGDSIGNDRVTITGTGFQDGCTVTFDGLSATDVQFVSDTEINCLTPAHAAGVAAIAVTNPDSGLCNTPLTFTYAVFDFTGIYYFNKNKSAPHDSYNNGIEKKIPNPTIRTALIGE